MSCLAPSGHALFTAAAEAIAPRPHVSFTDYLENECILPDGPNQGERFSFRGAPPLRGIAACLDPEHPCTSVTVRKSQQVGVSVLSVFWAHYLAEHEPANILYAAPSLDALDKFSNDKLQRVIDLMHRRRGTEVFRPVTSRSGTGSTLRNKRYAGGSMFLANGNSPTDLSSNTPRFGILDELSKFENIPVYGDPEKLAEGRFTSYFRSGLYKIFRISTPELDLGEIDAPSHCRIDRSFQRSDQRYFNIVCPHCGDRFAPIDSDEYLTIDQDDPDASLIHCTKCGSGLNDFQRVRAISHPDADWVPEKPEKGRQPGFHLDALVSKLVPIGKYARERIEAEKGDQIAQKAFWNLFKGRPFAKRGDAPEPEKIADRPKTVERARIVPPGGLILTMGVDVQHSGLYFEIVAFGRDRQNWSLDCGFLDGATDVPREGAWKKLNELVSAPLDDAWGRTREYDAVFIDAGDGGRANQVQVFCMGYENRHAIRGVGGFQQPAVSAPSNKAINLQGKRLPRKGLLWPVGTWSLKSEFFAQLARERDEDGFPPGYVHLGDHNDIRWARQVTAEFLTTEKRGGVIRQVWLQTRADNHFLDTRVYAMAAAEMVGLSKISAAQWDRLAADRGAPAGQELSLFSTAPEIAAAKSVAAPVAPTRRGRRIISKGIDV